VVRIRTILDADPSAVIRTLQHFQARNRIPQRVSARWIGEYIELEIEIADMPRETLNLIVAKIASASITVAAVVCD
jgi:hypothetical protein